MNSPSMIPMAHLMAALGRFGHAQFRPGQREAIETLLEKGRLLLVAPTGGGKSLTYQLPASLLPGTTLVISPLIALMQDQVAALDRCGVPATFLASTLSGEERHRRIGAMLRGTYKLVYVAPERLSSRQFLSQVATLDCPLLAVDEAHCISAWGHDFRPDYLQLGRLVEMLHGAKVLACTATATPVVRDEIIERLGLPADTPQILRGFARPNLALSATEVTGARHRREAVDAALAKSLGTARQGRGTAIIYSPTRKAAGAEAERLGVAGWRCRAYHAGMDGTTRNAVQVQFMSGELDIVVATNAFGMGIDRADVRAVIHLGPPGSLEAYYQEVGRAGRDGQRALGLLLYTGADLPLRRYLIENTGSGPAPDRETVEHQWNLFLELVRWADGGSCRHDAILRYFGDEEETLAGCGICDVCMELNEPGEEQQDPEAVTLMVRKALCGVARIHGRFGLGAAIHLLRGVQDQRLDWAGLSGSKTFGILAHLPEAWLKRLLRRLVAAGWIDFTGERRPVAMVTPAGEQVIQGERPVRLVLPPRRPPTAAGGRQGRTPHSSRHAVPPPPTLRPGDQTLMEALRVHRLAVARAQGVPPYVVAHDRTLRDVAALRPATRAQLLMVHGMGPAKVKRYGDGLLEVVRNQSSAGDVSPER